MEMNAGMKIGLIVGGIGALVGIVVPAMVGVPMEFMAVPLLTVGIVFFVMWRVFLRPAMETKRLKETGLDGTATILSAQETNMRINNMPLVQLTLDVEGPDGSHYETTTKKVISYFNVASFQPGTKVNVKIDRADQNNVVIV